MSTCDPTPIVLLILNYNGRELLSECLPSIVEAAQSSRHNCRVGVVDNASTDGSIDLLRTRFPKVDGYCQTNLGLCSYNRVLADLRAPIVVLMNNDVKLRRDSIDSLVAPLLNTSARNRCFMTAPLCWQFDHATYEGLKTAVEWRLGLVQATARFAGHERGVYRPGATASAGAAMAVSRERFLDIGGFDPLYLPGRLEDLDFALRGYLAGFEARYIPKSVAYHLGMATFGREFGRRGSDAMALRNTFLFQWKNLRHPRHVARQVAGLPIRLAWDVLRAASGRSDRFAFTRALVAALARAWRFRADGKALRTAANYDPRPREAESLARERAFFRRFDPREMTRRGNTALGRTTVALPFERREPVGCGHAASVHTYPRSGGPGLCAGQPGRQQQTNTHNR